MGFLLAAAAGAGFVAVGTGALLAPKTFSGAFGLPAEDRTALAYVRATGVRDVILGALVLASLGDPPALRRVLAFSSVLGLADAVTVAKIRGPQLQHVAHLGGFVALVLAALSADD
jgi:hypothetical protein